VLEEEEGLSGDLTDHSLGRWSNGCDRAVRSGGGGGKREFLHKRNLKEDREWMWCQIVKLLMPFIGQRREDRQCHEGETTDSEWSSSMLPFFETREEATLSSHGEGRPDDAAAQWLVVAAGVERHLDWPEVEDNQSGQLGRKSIWVEYSWGDQTSCRNGMGWERDILVEKNFGCCILNKKSNFWIKIEEIKIKSSFGIFFQK
jgi:hypothetical protein